MILAFLSKVGAKPCYSPGALEAIIQKAKDLKKQGRRCVVVFDLDDTTIKTRERTRRIALEFIGDDEVKKKYPERILSAVRRLRPDDMQFLMGDTLRTALKETPEQFKADADAQRFLKDFQGDGNPNIPSTSGYWGKRFLFNEAEYGDEAEEGAAKYLQRLVAPDVGVKVVYLTGRDKQDMYEGTVKNLRDNGFPISADGNDDGKSLLIMKPSKINPQTGKLWDDLTFKTDTVKSRKFNNLGPLCGNVENEPANLKGIEDQHPDAIAILNDTIHFPGDTVKPPKVSFLIKGFAPRSPGEKVVNCSGQPETTQPNGAAGAIR